MSYSKPDDKLLLNFSIKNCQKNVNYIVEITIEELSNTEFKSEEIKCNQDGLEIFFSKKMPCDYYFGKRQKAKINVIKKIAVDSNYKKKISERITLLSSLIASPDSIYERKLNDKNPNSEIISIKIEKADQNSSISVFDFFKGGLKLSCFISLDFSNEINNPLKNTTINYLNVLKNISSAIANYTKNHQFYVFGFGARPNNALIDGNIFNLNMNEDNSPINTIEKVIQKFNSCLSENKINPEDNRNFSSLIKKITRTIYSLYELRYYNVSFILTRGALENKDIQKTIDAIIESGYLPLTIFVIGIGKNDFSQIKKVLGSNHKCTSLGMEKMRNNVLFASLIDDFSNDDEKLIHWCIQELSKQIFEFYSLIKTTPENIYKENLKSIRQSFRLYNSSIAIENSMLSDSQNKNDQMETMNINSINNNPYNFYIKNKMDDNNNDILSKDNNNNIKEEKFVNKKPKIYESVLENKTKNNNNNNKNDINNNTKETSNPTPTPTPTDTGDDVKYIPKCSISDSIKDESKTKGSTIIDPGNVEPPAPIIMDNRKYCINTQSINEPNQYSYGYNQYAKNTKKMNDMYDGNMKYCSMEPQKVMNNFSKASGINSTKASENIKCSGFSLFGNNSIYTSNNK